MNRIFKSIVFTIALCVITLAADASVYTNPGSGYTEAWSTNGYFIWFVNGTYKLSPGTQIGLKPDTGNDAGVWIVLPTSYLLPQGVNDDINWAVNYVQTNGIPWRWGTCLQARTAYNVANCLH